MDLELNHRIDITASEEELPNNLLEYLGEIGAKAAASQAAQKLREVILEALNKEINKLLNEGRLKRIDGKWVFSSPTLRN